MRLAASKAIIPIALIVVVLQCVAGAQWREVNPVTGVQQQADGVLLTMKTGVTRVQVCEDSILRITYSPTSSFPKREDYVVIKNNWAPLKFNVASTDKDVTLTTAKLKLVIDKQDGSFVYSD